MNREEREDRNREIVIFAKENPYTKQEIITAEFRNRGFKVSQPTVSLILTNEWDKYKDQVY